MRRFGGAIVATWLAGLVLGATPAQAQLCKLLNSCAPAAAPAPAPEPTPAPTGESAAACEPGATDQNPANAPVAPALGRRLLARRPDGRLPWGFVEPSFGRNVGVSTGQRLYRKAGANVARLVLDWGAIEHERGGTLRWTPADTGYCAALEIGVRPLLTLSTVPRWALEPGAVCNSSGTGCRAAPASWAYAELRRFAELAAIRYPRAAGIEVWNEPNAADFWASPDPVRYVEFLRETYIGVKNGRPDMPVIGGALANHQSDLSNGSIGIYNFLNAMYELGAAELMDGLSFHPYPVKPLGHQYEYFSKTIDKVREITDREDGPGVRRLWLTELGAVMQNHPAPGSDPFDGPGQAQQLWGTWELANAMPDVDVIAYWTPVDVPYESRYGWSAKDWLGRLMPRPVLCTFSSRLGPGMSCSQPV